MEQHIDYAVEFARAAYSESGSKFFRAIILYGSVSKGRARDDSDLDIMLLKRSDVKGYYDHVSRLFKLVRESPVRYDFSFIEETVLLRDEYLVSYMKQLEDNSFYINMLETGLLFDGERFSKRVIDDPFFHNCIDRMKKLLQRMDLTGY